MRRSDLKMRLWGAALVAAACLAGASAGPAAAEGSLTGLCPQTTTSGAPAPELSCVPEPVPGEGWTLAAIEPVRDPGRLAVYRRLLAPYASYFAVPRDAALGYVGARLNTGSLSTGSADPGQGYEEMEVAIRVRETKTAEEGWFPLATSVNDSSQYTAGRLVGFPKFAADETITHDAKTGSWTYTSSPAGQGAEVFQRYAFSPQAPAGRLRRAARAELSRTVLYEDPMFTTARAWDENDPDWFPVRNKFTLTPLVPFLDTIPASPPVTGTPADGAMTMPAPALGTVTLDVSHVFGPAALPRFAGLLDPGPVTLPGMFWHGNGWVIVTSERLDGQPGLPGKEATGPNYGLGGTAGS